MNVEQQQGADQAKQLRLLWICLKTSVT